MVYPLDVHWMVYHPLEDGLRKIGWFTITIDEPLNWMVYSTFFIPPWFHHPLGGAVELSEDRGPYLNRAWKLGATKTLRNTLEVPQETN